MQLKTILTVRCALSSSFRTFIFSIIIPITTLMTSQRSERIVFLFSIKIVRLGDELCLDLYGGLIRDGTNLVLWYDCRLRRRQLIFQSAGNTTPICRNYLQELQRKLSLFLSEILIILTEIFVSLYRSGDFRRLIHFKAVLPSFQ